jgi:hypothetical protein
MHSELTTGVGRQIADKSYYVALLRQRITEITTEIDKMHQEIEQFEKDNQQTIALERRYYITIARQQEPTHRCTQK